MGRTLCFRPVFRGSISMALWIFFNGRVYFFMRFPFSMWLPIGCHRLPHVCMCWWPATTSVTMFGLKGCIIVVGDSWQFSHSAEVAIVLFIDEDSCILVTPLAILPDASGTLLDVKRCACGFDALCGFTSERLVSRYCMLYCTGIKNPFDFPLSLKCLLKCRELHCHWWKRG